MQNEAEMLLRLVAAAVLGGVIGWERETAGKSAGLRTHVLVGTASCLFVAVGLLVSSDFADKSSTIRIDPLSLIQAIAVGIGFLGSGIVHLRTDGDVPQGLTTAASIWAVAGIGLTAGFGKYLLAAGATAILLIVLRGIVRLERRLLARESGDKIKT